MPASPRTGSPTTSNGATWACSGARSILPRASFTGARIFAEAAAALQGGVRPATGPILVTVTGRETATEARFLGALPGAAFALAAARPLRPRHLERVEALFGREARAALEPAPLPGAAATERDLLARYLFAPPEVLADPARPRSQGPDGTVTLEEHAGVETEVEAAAGWVAREVLTRRTPLEDVAVLVPSHHPLVPLVASRIARLPWPGGDFPVHVAGGLPLVASAAGARVLALVRGLGAFLPAESMSGLLPSLTVKVGERDHLSFGEAVGVAWGVGTTGGSAARPEGALDWTPFAAARQAQLEKMVGALDEEAERREGWKIRPQLDALRAARPALDALVSLTRLVVEDRPLAEIAPALAAFLEAWMRLPGKGAAVRTMLAESLEGAKADSVASSVRGAPAMAFVEERLGSLRLSTLRFGEPAVYVGTVASAAGLEFQAVRILGLCEGALPSTVREDAVLPDRMREEAGPLVPLSGDRVLAQLHAFDRAVRGASAHIALSVPHGDAERSDREISSLLVEVGAALGRPDPRRQEAIPDLASLERTSFGPARAALPPSGTRTRSPRRSGSTGRRPRARFPPRGRAHRRSTSLASSRCGAASTWDRPTGSWASTGRFRASPASSPSAPSRPRRWSASSPARSASSGSACWAGTSRGARRPFARSTLFTSGACSTRPPSASTPSTARSSCPARGASPTG